ncbi:MAG: nicotinate phosphoribosyltransferase [Alphaproteobacteria bacterium]
MSVTPISERSLALFTDLYELRMARAYHALGMTERAVFSLFVRKLPPARNFLVACGLEPFIDVLERLRFDPPSIEYLSSLGEFPPDFIEWLRDFRFTGDIYAMPEGTPFFPNEPILEVSAPITEAQLLETLVMNQVGMSTMLASKAARVVAAAKGRSVVDFGSRRAHGIDAALKGARAFHIAGVDATSNVQAAALYGLQAAGTMAHSYIEAFASEAEAFERFLESYPETILLVDTYDTLVGVQRVIEIANRLGPRFKAKGIRLDSGDLGALAKSARAMLDEAGLKSVKIFASGGLDEREIARLLKEGAPIDAFGVGTELSVSGDAPSLDIAYKLTEYAGMGRMKFSTGKVTLPGRKQVFRRLKDGIASGDVIACADEQVDVRPLLECVMRNGERTRPPAKLAELRAQTKASLAALPTHLLSLERPASPYPVSISDRLNKLERECRQRLEEANL